MRFYHGLTCNFITSKGAELKIFIWAKAPASPLQILVSNTHACDRIRYFGFADNMNNITTKYSILMPESE